MNDIQSEFNTRWWRQMAATPVMLVALAPFIMRDRHAEMDPLVLVSGIGGLVLALGFSFWNWRCPSCSSYLGRRFFGLRHCQHCGTQLQP
jgi:hypothetical protein